MRATKNGKELFTMYEVLQRLKGISCVLTLLSCQTENTQFKNQAEALELVRDGVDSCIDELQKTTPDT